MRENHENVWLTYFFYCHTFNSLVINLFVIHVFLSFQIEPNKRAYSFVLFFRLHLLLLRRLVNCFVWDVFMFYYYKWSDFYELVIYSCARWFLILNRISCKRAINRFQGTLKRFTTISSMINLMGLCFSKCGNEMGE